jgi:membrane protein DedA with SNARE-associated domain/rhodanese-related sulfurtransferase
MSDLLLHTTYPILFLSVLAEQLCLPIPAAPFLISGGALAGTGRLSLIWILCIGVLGSLLGDVAWYEAGRYWGKPVLRLLCALATDPSLCIRKSRGNFARRGLPILLIAKLIPGLGAITPPLAGMSRSPRGLFLAYDACGAALWVATYAGIGYFAAERFEAVSGYISLTASHVILVFSILLLPVLIWKAVQFAKMVRELRSHFITPFELKALMDAGEKVAIIDLTRFEDDPEDSVSIPGAWRGDPTRMRRNVRVLIPEDVTLVVYCRSTNNFVSARVAAALRKRGVNRIRVLEGGLSAWKASGLHLSPTLRDPLTEMKRLGIEISPPSAEQVLLNSEPA